MNSTSFRLGALCAAVFLLISTGCQNNSRARQRSTSAGSSGWVDTGDFFGGPGFPEEEENEPLPLPTFAPGPSPSPVAEPKLPPIELRVEGVGYNEVVVPELPVGRKLKLQFIPGKQDSTVANSNFLPHYSKLGVYITVGSQTIATPMLDNGYAVGAAPVKSNILNFSMAVAENCEGQDEDCRELVDIKVSRPNYDYWCLNYLMYCPWTQVHATHPWNGTLLIETDDTEPLTSVQ